MRSRSLKAVLTLVAICAALLTGCTFDGSVDSLLQPPSLRGEQAEIYVALQNAVGNNISLQYPRSGSNLSAFTITDLDYDGDDEAIVFYETDSLSATENNLRIAVLDQIGTGWQSVCDIPADGVEIECVEIAPLGKSDSAQIIIGYSSADQSDKALAIYDYADNTLEQRCLTAYTLFDITDLDSDGEQELLVLSRATDTTNAKATLYRRRDNGTIAVGSTLDMRATFTDYSQILYTIDDDETPLIYIDGTVGSLLETEILKISDNHLSYCLEDSEIVEETARSVGLLSMLLDETTAAIPVQEPFLGYDENASDQVRLTLWLTFSGEELCEYARSYFAVGDGVIFFLPSKWYDTVTAINDPATGEIVFCRYDGKMSDNMTPLMRYRTTANNDEITACEKAGYTLLYTRGNTSYYLYIENEDDALNYDSETLAQCFTFLD